MSKTEVFLTLKRCIEKTSPMKRTSKQHQNWHFYLFTKMNDVTIHGSQIQSSKKKRIKVPKSPIFSPLFNTVNVNPTVHHVHHLIFYTRTLPYITWFLTNSSKAMKMYIHPIVKSWIWKIFFAIIQIIHATYICILQNEYLIYDIYKSAITI